MVVLQLNNYCLYLCSTRGCVDALNLNFDLMIALPSIVNSKVKFPHDSI